MHGKKFSNKFRNVFCEYVRLFPHIWNFNCNGFFFFFFCEVASDLNLFVYYS